MNANDFWKMVEEERKKQKNKNKPGQTSIQSQPSQTVTTNKSKNKETDEFWAKVEQYKQQEEKKQQDQSKADDFTKKFGLQATVPTEESAHGGSSGKIPEYEAKWFKGGGFSDGYDFGDVTKTILGTVGDLGRGVLRGVSGTIEGILDLSAYEISRKAGFLDAFSKKYGFLNTPDGWKIGDKKLNWDHISDTAKYVGQQDITTTMLGGSGDWLDQYSLLGKYPDAVAEGVGQLALIWATGGAGSAAGLSSAGVSALTTGVTGLSSMGSGMSEAYQGGATDQEAAQYGLISGTADAVTELIFGGMGKGINAMGYAKGLSSADDMFAKTVSSKISNTIAKNAVEFGIKAGAEGTEEVMAGLVQAVGKKMTYMSEEDLSQIIADENLLEQFLVGAMTSAVAQSPDFVRSNKAGTDFITGNTKNDQAVIDRVVKDRIAEMEAEGQTVTVRDKANIKAEVQEDLEKGYISTDTIEEMLGGDKFTAYQDTIKQENNALAELAELYEGDELKQKTEEFRANSKRSEAAQALRESVFDMVKDSKLSESYREKARRGQKFTADLTKYDEKQRTIVQKAIDSGVLNNTNRTHDMVDFVSRVAADTGVSFDFTNNEKLKGTIFAVNGKTVDGYITKDGVVINVNSKKYINTVVGHEITHALEGTKLYEALEGAVFAYAKANGTYKDVLKSAYDMYHGEDGYQGYEGLKAIKKEAVANMVGDYLFTDKNFISHLSAKNPNIFQKVWNEIKYMVKVARAGSDEAKKLLQVQKAFEEAYRSGGNTQSENSSGNIKYSLENNGKRKYNKRSKYSETETLFLRWENGSTPVGEVKKFSRFGKTRYYEKTESGSVELSKQQYIERNKVYAENTYRRAERRFGTTADYDETTQRGLPGDHISYRDTSGDAAVFGQTIREKLPDVTRGSESSTLRDGTGNADIKQTEYNEEASAEEQDASFVTFSNDYATIRNFMKDGDAPVKYSLSNEDTLPVKQGNYRVTGEEIAYEEQLPMADSRTGTEAETPVAEVMTGEGDLLPMGKQLEARLRESQKAKAQNLQKLIELNQRYTERFSREIAEKEAQLAEMEHPYSKAAKELRSEVEQLQQKLANVEKELAKRQEALTQAQQAAEQAAVAEEPVAAPERENRQEDPLANLRTQREEAQKDLDNYRNLMEQTVAVVDAEIGTLKRQWESAANQNSREAISLQEKLQEKELYRQNVVDGLQRTVTALEEKLVKLNSENRERAEIRNYKANQLTDYWRNLIGSTMFWKDLPTGIAYKTKTLRRILREVVRGADGKPNFQLADQIYDSLETTYDKNEASLKISSRNYKKAFADLKLNHEEDQYAHMLGELEYNPETELSAEKVSEFFVKHKNKINVDKVQTAIEEARRLFDDLFVRVNAVLKANGMREIGYRKGYFPHFTNPKQNRLMRWLGWKPINTEIPTSIAGLTETFRPGKSYQSFDKARKGDQTDYSLLQGLDMYIHGALDWIYHTEDIQRFRSLENWIRTEHADNNQRERIQAIIADETLDAEQMQDQIAAAMENKEMKLGGLVRELRNRANNLANKKAAGDRKMEDDTNRKIYSVMTNVNNRVNANMVVGSIRSAATNFIPLVQSWHEVNPVYTLVGIGQTIKGKIRGDDIIEKSTFLTNRLREEENLYKTGWDKVINGMAWFGNRVDSFTSQSVWRSKYFQNLKTGMSEDAAIADADQFAKNLMGGRSRGNMPTIFNEKNPVTKLFTAFQLEVANQYGYMFKDVIQDAKIKASQTESNAEKAKVYRKLVNGYAEAFLGAYVFNSLFSLVTGSTAAFDPIRIIQELLGDMGFGDDEEKEPEEWDQILLKFGENVLQEVPFIGGLLGGGRVPISNILPYGSQTNPFTTMLKDLKEGKVEDMVEELLSPLWYLVLPAGGGQARKTVQGLAMFDDDLPISGSYTDSGNLRFPVEDTPWNRVQAGLFGQYASENARDFFDSERKPLGPNQIQEYIDSDLPIRDYWDYREGLSGLDTLDAKGEYIAGLDLPIATKNLFINNIAHREEPIDMTNYHKYPNFSEFDWGEQNPEKYAFLQEHGMSYADYEKLDEDSKDAYSWAFNNPEKYEFVKGFGLSATDYYSLDEDSKDAYSWAYNNPESYTFSRSVTGDVVEYRRFARELNSIKADKDENGKSISGSRKDKVYDYIMGLDIDDGAKAILFKSEYPSEDIDNKFIIDYLNKRLDISDEEKVLILKKLGFKVDSRGRVTW